jgi:hypothetical protein
MLIGDEDGQELLCLSTLDSLPMRQQSLVIKQAPRSRMSNPLPQSHQFLATQVIITLRFAQSGMNIA